MLCCVCGYVLWCGAVCLCMMFLLYCSVMCHIVCCVGALYGMMVHGLLSVWVAHICVIVWWCVACACL